MKADRLVRISSKGQIVLPKRLRDKMGYQEGDYLFVGEYGKGIVLLGKSLAELFDQIVEPIRQEAEAQGFTREELMKMIKDMRARREPDGA